MVWDASHGDGLTATFAARSQGDIEQLGSAPGILIKQLVKITHAVKHHGVWMLSFDAKVLLHHWCVCTGRHGA